eukprot:CAMPEP_0183294994 /NCGR_PEP_ID=MMETSP0160_2-20130417/3111_1 /TAXON_ID=2839 ORGANISM="Odontella Sinensis, Strain Grunow 1884" /NCGR_SAMPLE_ID=MMETSP0160_2 /ASSEMBLY_ACC=CAM_ASM_000250 /LENGTH=46 /DNA_ID= /DNA_START= /DNA_END= /DNA_ORIENTATION=
MGGPPRLSQACLTKVMALSQALCVFSPMVALGSKGGVGFISSMVGS